ncbi:M23 family metallopeptidase [Tessaracoccus antarcticus]|uniref:M23 family metallopeptidase n=1 Tax=Tessaracoccus antarcticus TaxID=2479848 RepID=A0A3M0G2M5_9ACTN|nr:M23 family metallopeptidase [Tessaracoccus antarcticus]RMB58387.1 M23 family metallopeptidase [Tessaracoccus antarcticus]
MTKLSAIKSPRRAADSITVSDVEVTTETAGTARRRRSSSVGRGMVSSVLAGVLVAGGLFGWAATSRDGAEDLSSEQVSADVAVPQAAINSAEKSFSDREQAASRGAVRSNLTEAVAGEAAKDRDAVLETSVEEATKSIAAGSAAEREAQMAEDMQLVEKQAAKLKKEAEEAARRLEEARKAAAAAAAAKTAAGSSDAPSQGNEAAIEVSAEDLAAISSSGGSMPLKSNFRVGARFGATGSWSRYHTGQDFPAPIGTPIYAVASGIILSPTAGGWAGTNVVIQHANGGATLYAHMSKRVASTGQAVKAGQLIGYVGVSGRSFGPHLHMEYYAPGVTPGKVYSASNPITFMRGLGINI